MKTCPSCYREMEDVHAICPDCGTLMPDHAKASSEDASESTGGAADLDFTPTDQDIIIERHLDRLKGLAENTPKVKGAFELIRKWNSNNKTVIGSLHTILDQLNGAMQICQQYAELLQVMRSATEEKADGQG